jgi:molybdopterin converting factor small subunit
MIVRFFARAKDLAGVESLTLADPPATAGELRRFLAEQLPALAPLLAKSALAVNDDFADDGMRIPTDAEIAVLPPVSGGIQ